AARVNENGAVFLSLNYAPKSIRSFVGNQKFWQQWAAVAWADVRVGDFDGDGKSDLVARYAPTGQVFVSRSFAPNRNYVTNPDFQQDWDPTPGTLPGLMDPRNTWVDIEVGDFNGDGRDDFVERREDGGWYLQLSDRTTNTFMQVGYGAWAG